MKISVIIPTTDPWPAAEPCYKAVKCQSALLNAEIIIADGSNSSAMAKDMAMDPQVVYLPLPGLSVFALRAHAVMIAKGDIIIITEDHAEPGPNWIEEIMETYRLHPDLQGVTGPVFNLSSENATDRANFMITFHPFQAPLRSLSKRITPPIANVSFRKGALPAVRDYEEGWLEFYFLPQLSKRSGFVIAEGALVGHRQSHSFRETCTLHYHNGRTTTAYALRSGHIRRNLGRMITILAFPILSFASMHTSLRKRGLRRSGILSFIGPYFCLTLATVTGQMSGMLWGEGDSPNKLQ